MNVVCLTKLFLLLSAVGTSKQARPRTSVAGSRTSLTSGRPVTGRLSSRGLRLCSSPLVCEPKDVFKIASLIENDADDDELYGIGGKLSKSDSERLDVVAPDYYDHNDKYE